MNWTRPQDLRAQVQKLWDRGELLAASATAIEKSNFPRRLMLKGPSSSEMSSRFDEVRAWIAELRNTPHCRFEMRKFTHPMLGANEVPNVAWIDSADAALAWLGKRRDAIRFAALLAQTRDRQPLLVDWLAKRPLRALDLAEEWTRLLDIVAWRQAHPQPGVYLRQVDIPGVHSKFIEAQRGVLAELLDRVLPPDAIHAPAAGVGQFAARYGFREKPVRIRFRTLDPSLVVLPGHGANDERPDIALDAESFAALNLPIRRVFITENETNFLSFPPVSGSIVIFGAGYGWDALAKAHWLGRCTLHYWGDIDTHGFGILDQLRSRFGHVESFLMDRATLMSHETLWGQEDDQVLHDLPRLTSAERALFDELRDNRIRKNLRLEQEMIGFGQVVATLAEIAGKACRVIRHEC
jgi:hypothetical protein